MPIERPFGGYAANVSAPLRRAVAITPHDTNDLDFETRALSVNEAGNLVVKVPGSETAVTIAVLAGVLYPIAAEKVLSTNTTATGITGWV